MSQINETGEVGYCKASLYLTAKIHIKARLLRLLANLDGLWWMLRNKR